MQATFALRWTGHKPITKHKDRAALSLADVERELALLVRQLMPIGDDLPHLRTPVSDG